MSSIWMGDHSTVPGSRDAAPAPASPTPPPIVLRHQVGSGVAAVLAERGARYGDFGDVARTAQGLKNTMRVAPGWTRLTAAQREGLDMIQCKVARMLHGDPAYMDNIVDICGYAELVHAAMRKGGQTNAPR